MTDNTALRASDTHPIIIAKNLSFSLPIGDSTIDILKNITFSLPKGKKIAITGASGSGKTSLLMLLAGLEQPSGGTLRIDGEALETLSADALTALRNDKIGIVFQEFHLLPTMNARENVALPLELRGDKDAYRKADRMLDAVGLSHRREHFPAQLSGGEQQRTAIARACVGAPSIVLADEPTGNLDEATGEKVISLLFSMQQQHDATLVLITHDTALAARCDSEIQMRDGCIINIIERRP